MIYLHITLEPKWLEPKWLRTVSLINVLKAAQEFDDPNHSNLSEENKANPYARNDKRYSET